MKLFFTVFLSLLVFSVSAQGPVITPLKGNAQLKQGSRKISAKRALNDTLKLPFFDDFTSTTIYPDMRLWLDSHAYINSHFPISPPSYGVATFDNLDKKGRPYRSLSGVTAGASDSLTTHRINLKTYLNGVNTVNYTVADSIYLSFFFQTQGIGDPLDGTDSLVLKFRDAGGNWQTVWKTRGTSLKPFTQVMIPILDEKYLSPAFQFRFINFGRSTGNMNQWHIDYIRMKASRNMHDTEIHELAINSVPVGPLSIYESMPYSHFKAAPAANLLDSHSVTVRNNNFVDVNIFYGGEVRNTYNKLIRSYPLTLGANIRRNSDATIKYAPLKLDTFSAKDPVVRIRYQIDPESNDFTVTNDYNAFGNNNEYTKNTYFRNYFAYDDGSAEGGFGLDYGSLPSGPGYSALKFQTFKADTLRGLSVFFNRSVADVTFRPFTMMVWKTISEPPANNTSGDVILKKVDLPTTFYADSLNGFVNIIFDTAIILSQGNFYVGWQQTSNYILNVGYDANYKYLHQGGHNPNLFYNLNGYWEKVNSTITGVPMIRPLFGAKIYNPSNIRKQAISSKVLLYPNPSGSSTVLMLGGEKNITAVKVYDISGKVCLELAADDIREFHVGQLPAGFYQVLVTDEHQQVSIHKYIKN